MFQQPACVMPYDAYLPLQGLRDSFTVEAVQGEQSPTFAFLEFDMHSVERDPILSWADDGNPLCADD